MSTRYKYLVYITLESGKSHREIFFANDTEELHEVVNEEHPDASEIEVMDTTPNQPEFREGAD